MREISANPPLDNFTESNIMFVTLILFERQGECQYLSIYNIIINEGGYI